MQPSPTITVAQEIGRAFLFAPFWWYGPGMIDRIKRLLRAARDCGRFFHFTILVRHLFTPLFGTKGWESWAVSVLVRFGHLLYTFIITFAYGLLYLGAFLAWFLIPVIILWQIAYHAGL